MYPWLSSLTLGQGSAICNQTRLDVTSENYLFWSYNTRSVNPGEAFALTCWLIYTGLLASRSVVFPLEDWRKAHTPPAKLAAWPKLNQTHPVCLQNVIMSQKTKKEKLPPTYKQVWTLEECVHEKILSYRSTGSGGNVLDVASGSLSMWDKHCAAWRWIVRYSGSEYSNIPNTSIIFLGVN